MSARVRAVVAGALFLAGARVPVVLLILALGVAGLALLTRIIRRRALPPGGAR